MNASKSSDSGRRRLPRFSLRMLVLVMFVGPIGGWFWWSSPFEEESITQEEPEFLVKRRVPRYGDDDYVTLSFSVLRPAVGKERKMKDEAMSTMLRKIGFYRRDVRTIRRRGLDVVRDGLSRSYNKKGQLIIAETWRNGVLDGPIQHWDSQGTLRLHGQYKKGERDGEWTTWHASGNVYRQGKYELGAKVGVWSDSRDNGSMDAEIKYAQGVQVERRHHYGTDGHLDVMTFDDEEKIKSLRKLDLTESGDRIETWNFQYRDGLRDGEQVIHHRNGATAFVGYWKNGTPVGTWTWWNDSSTLTNTVAFVDGEVAVLNGGWCIDVTQFCQADPDNPRDLRNIRAFDEESTYVFQETPISEVVDYLTQFHNVPILQNKRALGDMASSLRVTEEVRQVPLDVALLIALSPYELTCVYRFEVFQITTIEDAFSWRDASGLDELAPPLSIERGLNDATAFEFSETPLSAVAEFLTQFNGVSMKLSPLLEMDQPKITLSLRGISLRSALGIMLNEYGLRCEMDGETIVIHKRESKE